MQLSIHIELDDNANAADIAHAVFHVAHGAADIVSAGGPMPVDEERHINVERIPFVWSASIFRPQ